jgi:hypothetical protein
VKRRTRFVLVTSVLCFAAVRAADLEPSQRAPVEQSKPLYDLRDVEARPIPRDAHFALWRQVALKQCAAAPSRYNLSTSKCISLVEARSEQCASRLAGEAPLVISSTATAREIGRKYLNCVTPHYFCRGVEVHTAEEVRANCDEQDESAPALASQSIS